MHNWLGQSFSSTFRSQPTPAIMASNIFLWHTSDFTKYHRPVLNMQAAQACHCGSPGSVACHSMQILVHKVTLGENLLLQLRFYSANYRIRSVPYLFLALGMNNGHTEDAISADHRRIPNIWMRSKPPPNTMDMQFDERIWALRPVLHSHTASVTVNRSLTQERL